MKFNDIFNELLCVEELDDVSVLTILKVMTSLLKILDNNGLLHFEVMPNDE